MNLKEIDDLLNKLTLNEKISLIHANGLFKNGDVARLGIKPLKMADGPRGVRQDFVNDNWVLLNNNDDFVTYLPSGAAIASSFNLELAKLYGQVLGNETRGRGKDIILAPSVNIKRSPLNGRNFEYLSEDPFLTSKMAVEMVKGIQEYDVASCIKHFAANNQETDRLKVDVKVSEKALHEIYFPPFKKAVKEANLYSIMGAYNKINGQYCSQSYYLLNQVLRDTWGFKGAVISDWSAVNNTLEAANSGIDIEMSVTNNFDDYYMANPLKKLVEDKIVPIEKIDFKVKNILTLMNNIKMFENTRKSGTFNSLDNRLATYRIANETIVLLKNLDNNLPLKKDIKKILVIGDNATRLHSNAGGSAEIKALYEISPLMALKQKLGGNVEIDYVKGYYVDDLGNQGENWQESSLESNLILGFNYSLEVLEKQRVLREEAIKLASNYEHIIFFGGLNHAHDLEGQDRFDIKLPYNQEILIKELAKINPNLIVYLQSGSALSVSSFINDIKSLMWSSYNGMHGASSLIDTIFGDVNPSGKLTETWAKKLNDYPSHSVGEFPGNKEVNYKEDVMVGYKHFYDKKITPEFYFGHGLSYSSFLLSNFRKEITNTNVLINFDIENISSISGQEVVQLYILSDDTKVPILKAFNKIKVKANEKINSNISLCKKDLEFYDENIKDLVFKTGKYKILVGTSIKNILFETEIEIMD